MSKKYRLGFIIGRFQPFHKGHKYLIEESLKLADKIIIGIGSANKSDEKNPWSWEERKKVIETFLQHEGLEKNVKDIIPLFDNPDDDVWFQNLQKATGQFDVTIGNNPWNNGIIERHGIPAIAIGFKKRHVWEGVQIRQLMNKKEKWEDRVPDYLLSFISKA